MLKYSSYWPDGFNSITVPGGDFGKCDELMRRFIKNNGFSDVDKFYTDANKDFQSQI